MARNNKSNRLMVRYASSKSDPICKWRNASPETVVELVSYLPKEPLAKDIFRDQMKDAFNGSYFRTGYQLALQLGLYYEDDIEYIPRFDHNITKDEAVAYLHKWASRYYVPNPFTKKGFKNVTPSLVLVNALAEYLEDYPTKPNLATAGAALFGGEMGNLLCVKYIINEFSNIIEIDKEHNMKLLCSSYGSTTVPYNRDDKQAFFEHFK